MGSNTASACGPCGPFVVVRAMVSSSLHGCDVVMSSLVAHNKFVRFHVHSNMFTLFSSHM